MEGDAGVEIPDTMQGRSFRKVLAGNTPKDWPQSMYYQYWMHFEPSIVPAHLGVRTHDYKLIFYYGSGFGLNGTTDNWDTPIGWELYDLKNDPKELHNIYGKEGYETISTELKEEILRLQKQYKLDLKEYPGFEAIMKSNWN